MYLYETLERTAVQALHQAFLAAFSDYAVDIGMPLEAFRVMLGRRGFVPECSVGAFREPGHELVGFVLNGLRDFRGRPTAYDLGTGIAPAHRGRGVSRQMLQKALELLAARQVEQYLLEVLQSNRTALALYRSHGFGVTREFSCFALDRSGSLPRPPHHRIHTTGFDPDGWEWLEPDWAFRPSWQNSIDSLCAAPKAFACAVVELEGRMAGWGVVEKRSGDLPLLVVRPEFRRRGIATAIVAALQNITGAKALQVLNVDDSCGEIKLFLEAAGFAPTVRQYEMMLALAAQQA